MPMGLLFGGVFGGTGAGVVAGVGCTGGKCSDLVDGVLIGAVCVGVAAFATGLVMIVTYQPVATADVSRRRSALRATPEGLSVTF